MNYKILSASFALTLVISCYCHARPQQSKPPTQTENPDANTSASPEAEPANSTQSTGVAGEMGIVTSSSPVIRTMNGAGALPSGRVSAVQFGPIYLQSVDFFQAGDELTATGQNGSAWHSQSILRANIVLDHAWRTSHFAVQYQPRLYSIDGMTKTDTANLNAAWTTNFQLTPVFSASFSNNFNYYSLQSQFDNLGLQSDLTTGSLVQSHFLEGAGHFLTDHTELSFRYLLGPRSRVTVTPFFQYYTSSNSQTASDSQGAGGTANYSYDLSATQTLGITYQVTNTHFSALIPSTLYQSFLGNYAQQLSPTWHLSLAAGATLASSKAVGSGTSASVGSKVISTTASGSLELIKAFRDSNLAFEYYRGQSIGLQVTNGFADRYDLSYGRRLSKRTGLNLGVGYYREFLSLTNTSGIYSTVGLGYKLTERWSAQIGYSFKDQKNGGGIFGSGQTHYVSLGIRWEPGQHSSGY